MIGKLGAMAKLIPLFSIIAYGIGFISFVIYFIKMKAMNKVNFFTYPQLSDHITMFGIGVVLSVITLLLLSPSIFIYDLVLKEGRTLLKRGLSAIGIYFFMGIFMTSILPFKSNMELLEFSGALFIMSFFIAFMGTFKIPNMQQPMGNRVFFIVVFLGSALFFFKSPDALIRMSGYGNQWACLSISSSEARFIQTNPNLKDVLKYDDNGYSHTNQKVFILLKLRDYVFFSKGKEKAEDIEVLQKSEVHIYNVTPTSEGSCGRL